MLKNVLQNGLIVSLFFLSTEPMLHATLPALWPTFSTPTTIVNVNLLGTSASPDDLLAETTLAGAYNQLQGSARLYISSNPDDPYWLPALIPSTITVSSLSFTATDPDGALKAMLTSYGSSITGYYICDPVNALETCQMATTLAGIHRGMVVNPDNLAVMAGYPIPLLLDLRTAYNWIGGNQTLVANTTINKISNPSGASGTTGWSTAGVSSGQTLTATTYTGQDVINWKVAANEGGDTWAQSVPAVSLGQSYVFSVQIAGTGTVFLDGWDGTVDYAGSPITLTSGFQTLQLCIPIPSSSDSSNGSVLLQVRSHNSSSAANVYFRNASVVSNQVAVDTFQYNNVISGANPSILVQGGGLKDYAIAAKMTTFQLTSNNADEKTLYGNMIAATPHNTPVMGYIESENNDVSFLSGAGEGHFLNASDNYFNGSVWASLPQLVSLPQAPAGGIKTTNGTVYVAFGVSDGDNASFLQHRMQNDWAFDQFLGAVPMAWTVPPGAINFSPAMMSHYFEFQPQSYEMMAGPSGIGYATNMTGSDLSSFSTLTNEFMTAESMSTVTSWQSDSSQVPTFAADVNVPHVVWRYPYTYALSGSTVIDGQDTSYLDTPAQQISAIESYVSSNWSSSAPLFFEAMANGWALTPDDMLYVTQQLQSKGGHPYVFLTPSELALTEEAYHAGTGGSLPTTNAQAVAGSTLVSSYPQNLVDNAIGINGRGGLTRTGWALGTSDHYESLIATQYNGYGVEKLRVPAGASSAVYAYSYLNTVSGSWYLFSVNVAGQGTANINVWDGTANHHSATITLTSTFQTISLMVQMQTVTAGQLQVSLPVQTGTGIVYFQNNSGSIPGWAYSSPGTAAATMNIVTATYNYQPALNFTIPASEGSDVYVSNGLALNAGTGYTFSVDVAGSGSAFLDAWDGATDHASSAVTLGSGYQTLTLTATAATSGVPRLEVRSHTSASPTNIYFRNASVTPVSGTVDFTTGVETGQTSLTWTNTVDSTSPGGGQIGVSSAVLGLSTTSMSHGGSNSIHYGGTASGGSSTHSYMQAFSNSSTLASTSRLSYWIYPETPLGFEPGANSTTGQDSTCVAVDIIFTDGTALRNLSVTDQYGNHFNPTYQCNHLQPDHWNYVTANLGSLSGKVISRIDIGYDQNGTTGNFSGYVDDITLAH